MVAMYSDPPTTSLVLRIDRRRVAQASGVRDGGNLVCSALVYRGSSGFGANAQGEFWNALASTTNINSIGSLPPGVSVVFSISSLNLVALNNGIPLTQVFGALEVTGTGNLLGGGPSAPPGGYQAYDDITSRFAPFLNRPQSRSSV